MVYDRARKVMVLFGGNPLDLPNQDSYLGDTWEWGLDGWALAASSGPSNRAAHAMAYDEARGVSVLYGGNYAGDPDQWGTWEWDGSHWRELPAQWPFDTRLIAFHSMAYDSARHRIVMFGVYGGAEFDGTRWNDILAEGPVHRLDGALAYDRDRGVAVLFGGLRKDNAQELGDTWEWNGSAWTLRVADGPSPRSGHRMVYDEQRHRTVLFGGRDANDQQQGDTWEWDGQSWKELPIEGPPARSDHTMAYDSDRGLTVLFGGTRAIPGNASPRLDDTWEFDGKTWHQTGPAHPAARIGHTIVFDSRRGVPVLFGGLGTEWGFIPYSIAYGDTWERQAGSWVDRQVSGPPPRLFHAAAFDEARSQMVIFGGMDAHFARFDDTWLWNGVVWTEEPAFGPSAKSGQAMAYDSERSVSVLFGGNDGQSYSRETWEWDGASWSLRATDGPSARIGHVMAYDRSRAVTVLFSGDKDGVKFGDTWEWNGSAWKQMAQEGPTARTGAALAYDPALGGIVLFSGLAQQNIEPDLWVWNGVAWTRIDRPGPLARYSHAGTYDQVRGELLIFGGNNWGTYEDTWTLQSCAVCPADCDSNSVLDLFDFLCFVNGFNGGAPTADCDGSGALDLFDFLCFVNAFNTGC